MNALLGAAAGFLGFLVLVGMGFICAAFARRFGDAAVFVVLLALLCVGFGALIGAGRIG